MWQSRIHFTPLVRHVQVHMYRNLTYFTVFVVVWLVCKNVWWGETQKWIHEEKELTKRQNVRKAYIERSKQNRDKIVDKNRAEASARATAHPSGNRIVI